MKVGLALFCKFCYLTCRTWIGVRQSAAYFQGIGGDVVGDEPKVKLTVRILLSTKHFLENLARKIKAKRRGGAPAYGEAIEVVAEYVETQMAEENRRDSVTWSEYVGTVEREEIAAPARRKRSARIARRRKREARRSIRRVD